MQSQVVCFAAISEVFSKQKFNSEKIQITKINTSKIKSFVSFGRVRKKKVFTISSYYFIFPILLAAFYNHPVEVLIFLRL